MPFKILTKVREEFMSHVRPEMLELSQRAMRVTWVEYETLRANSYERRLIVKNLDDNALCKLYRQCEQQIRPLSDLDLARDYNDAVCRELAPLMASRFEQLQRKVKALEEVAFDIFDEMTGHENYDPNQQSFFQMSDSYVVPLAVALCSVEPKSWQTDARAEVKTGPPHVCGDVNDQCPKCSRSGIDFNEGEQK